MGVCIMRMTFEIQWDRKMARRIRADGYQQRGNMEQWLKRKQELKWFWFSSSEMGLNGEKLNSKQSTFTCVSWLSPGPWTEPSLPPLSTKPISWWNLIKMNVFSPSWYMWLCHLDCFFAIKWHCYFTGFRLIDEISYLWKRIFNCFSYKKTTEKVVILSFRLETGNTGRTLREKTLEA